MKELDSVYKTAHPVVKTRTIRFARGFGHPGIGMDADTQRKYF